MKSYCLAIAALIGASSAGADTVALTSSRTTGNQSFTGALGTDFNVLTPILVTQLGAFDSGANGFAGTVQVGIFNRSTQTLFAPSASLTGSTAPLLGNSRFVDVPDFILPVGNYSIVAVGFSSLDPNGNFTISGQAPTANTDGGSIAFVGQSRWTTSTTLTFPLGLDSGPILYDAGTFQYLSAVPEAASAHMFVAGLLAVSGIVALRRRGTRAVIS